MIHMIFLK